MQSQTIADFPASTGDSSDQAGVLRYLSVDRIIEDSHDDRPCFRDVAGLIAPNIAGGDGNPIIVVPCDEVTVPATYRIVIGRGQFRAARDQGLSVIRAIICESMGEVILRLRSLVCDTHQDRVNPAEVALALRSRLDDDPSMTHEELGCMLGQDDGTWVSHRLRILDLPADLLARVVLTQLAISAHALGLIARLHDRRWQEELIDALLEGKNEEFIRRRIRQLKGKASKSRFKVDFKTRHQGTVTIRSRFKRLSRQQRREILLDALAQDEKECELEEARALA